MIAGFVAGLLAHQSDRWVRGLDTDVQLIARYTIGLLTVMGVAAGGRGWCGRCCGRPSAWGRGLSWRGWWIV